MTLIAIRGAFELGLIYSLVAAGLFVSYRILNLADLTVDGSFTLGAATSMMITLAGSPWISLGAAVLTGAAAGLITALLQTKLKIQPILAGILTMTSLYSINLKVMDGQASVNVIGKDTIFTTFNYFGSNSKLILIALIMLISTVLLILFLNTQVGLALRASGDNPNMVRSSSINVDFMKTVGLIIANALVGLSGALLAQYQRTAYADMGVGVVVTGLASLIIGDVIIGGIIYLIFRKKNMLTGVISVVFGAVIYRIIIAFVLQYKEAAFLKMLKINESDIKLISSIIIILAISYPAVRDMIKARGLRRRNRHA